MFKWLQISLLKSGGAGASEGRRRKNKEKRQRAPASQSTTAGLPASTF